MSEINTVALTTSAATPGAKTGYHVWTDSITVYHLSHERDFGTAVSLLRLYKSVDGGVTWDEGAVVPSSGVTTPLARQVSALWYDRWTPGQNGKLIHIVSLELNALLEAQPFFTSYDTETGLFSTAVVVDAVKTAFVSLADQGVSITKAVSGDLIAMGWRTAGAGDNFTARSTDDGATWSPITSGIDNDSSDHVRLIPATGNEANEDVFALYWDRTASDFRLKFYDQSLNSWSSTDIAAAVNDRAGEYVPISVAVRPSDRVAFVAYWCQDDGNASFDDICIAKITDATTIAQQARLNQVTTREKRAVAIECDENTGDLYLYQQDFHTKNGILKSKSTDDGVTWVEVSRVIDSGDAEQFSQCPLITATGGRFQPIASRLTDSTWYLAEDVVEPIVPPVQVQTNTLAYYLPSGRAFGSKDTAGTVTRGLLRGLAVELLRSEALLEEFRQEILPDETILFIDEWESAVGIPDECFSGNGSIDQRRNDVLVKLASLGVQTANDFQTLANLLGVGLQMSNGADHFIYGVEPFIGFPNNKTARFTIVVDFELTVTETFTYTFPIVFGESELIQVECLFTKLKPANVNILFTNF